MAIEINNLTRREADRHLAKGSFSDYMRHREFQFLNEIVQRLFPQGIQRYLDFACGTGQILSRMEKMAEVSYGLDLRQSMMEAAKRKCKKSQFVVADVTNDDLKEVEPVHLITAFRFFGKAHNNLRRSVFTKLNDLLVDGGYLIFNNHRNSWSAISSYKRLGKYLDTYSDLNYWKIRTHLRVTNFKLIRTYGIGAWLLSPDLNTHAICNSRLIQHLEPISLLPFVGPFCPDMIMVAQKKKRTITNIEGQSEVFSSNQNSTFEQVNNHSCNNYHDQEGEKSHP